MSDGTVGRVVLTAAGGSIRPLIQLVTERTFVEGPWTSVVIPSVEAAQALQAQLAHAIKVIEEAQARAGRGAQMEADVAGSGTVIRGGAEA